MDVSSWAADASGNFLIGRRCQSHEPIGLVLESRDRDGPKASTAAQLLAALGDIDMGRALNRRRPIEAVDALDGCDLGVPHTARPGIDGRRFVAGVDGELGQANPRAMLVKPRSIEQ